MKKAITYFIMKEAFFASILLHLKIEEVTFIPTMATDGKSLLYNKKFKESLSQLELEGVILHELLHIIFIHGARGKAYEHERYNAAADYSVNLHIKDMGFTLPKGALLDEKYRKDGKPMPAEEIYPLLPEDLSSIINPMPGDIMEMDEEELGRMFQQAVYAGNIPGALSGYLKDFTKPTLSWKTLLRRFVATITRNDYTWTIPNRRYKQYLPTLRKPEIGDIIFIVDTSGSMMGEDIRIVFSELKAAVELLGTLKIISVDCRVQDVSDISDISTLKVHGGGGTSFAPGFSYIREKGLPCQAIVYLTDGYASTFAPHPGVPVLWVVTGGEFTPPYGEVIQYEKRLAFVEKI